MNRFPIIIALGFGYIAFLLSGCAGPPRLQRRATPDVRHPAVRVLLAFSDSEYDVKCSGRYVTRGTTAAGGQVVYYCSRPIHLAYEHGRWILSERNETVLETDLAQVSVHAKNQKDHLTVNGKAYLGSISFYPAPESGGPPRVINRINIDDYLVGVLPPELGKRTAVEFEAVKAQAVAARTYALSHLGQYEGSEYDLRGDHHDQIYVGLQQPYDWVKKAVVQTAGEVLRYNGDLIEAYYHSTCGGQTDDITAVWGKNRRPYLVPTKDDTFCRWSKYYDWSESWDSRTLKENFLAYLKSHNDVPYPAFDHIISLRTEGRTIGGRVAQMVVITDRGEWRMQTDRIRWAMGRPSIGGPILQSARFDLRPEYDENGRLTAVTAIGRGYGHGVGMCQCGMIGRARAGQNYRQILTHYYAGATVEKTY